MKTSKQSILLITQSKNIIDAIRSLLEAKTEINVVQSSLEAKKQLLTRAYTYCIICLNASDGYGIDLSIEISSLYHIPIGLFVKREIFDQVVYKTKDQEIFVSAIPTNSMTVYQSICMIETYLLQKNYYEQKITKLKRQRQEDRIIYQAKLYLIQDYNWSEEKAHKYLEKTAMDTRVSITEIARSLLFRRTS